MPPLFSLNLNACGLQRSTGPLNISGLPAAGQNVVAGVLALYCLKYWKVQNMATFSAGTPLPTCIGGRTARCRPLAASQELLRSVEHYNMSQLFPLKLNAFGLTEIPEVS